MRYSVQELAFFGAFADLFQGCPGKGLYASVKKLPVDLLADVRLAEGLTVRSDGLEHLAGEGRALRAERLGHGNQDLLEGRLSHGQSRGGVHLLKLPRGGVAFFEGTERGQVASSLLTEPGHVLKGGVFAK